MIVRLESHHKSQNSTYFVITIENLPAVLVSVVTLSSCAEPAEGGRMWLESSMASLGRSAAVTSLAVPDRQARMSPAARVAPAIKAAT